MQKALDATVEWFNQGWILLYSMDRAFQWTLGAFIAIAGLTLARRASRHGIFAQLLIFVAVATILATAAIGVASLSPKLVDPEALARSQSVR